MDNLQDPLRRFAERASRYAINLDGRVHRGARVVLGGGNAIVYRGTLQPDGISIAIKTARGSPPVDDRMIKRALREVHTCSKLRHQNVISVLGITTEFDGTVSIVSHWMENGNAHDYVQNTTINPGPLMLGIAQGLQYLHTRQGGAVFHGDLKGSNVLISDSGQAVLADFDLSLLVDSTFSLTTSGRAGYTLHWTAPEILEGGVGGQKSAEADVWSFGMTLLELFTRKIPFHPFTLHAVAYRVSLGRTPDRPSDEDTCSRLTDEWWTTCVKCWNFDPLLRPRITDVLQTIRKIQQ